MILEPSPKNIVLTNDDQIEVITRSDTGYVVDLVGQLNCHVHRIIYVSLAPHHGIYIIDDNLKLRKYDIINDCLIESNIADNNSEIGGNTLRHFTSYDTAAYVIDQNNQIRSIFDLSKVVEFPYKLLNT